MSRKTHMPIMLIGAFFITVSVYMALALGMTILLILPPLYTSLLSFTSPRRVAVGASLLSGLGLMLFVDPLHAVLYTLTGAVFGILVYSLSYALQRVEVIVVLMGTYLSSVYVAYIFAARALFGVDVLASIKTAIVQTFGSELAAMGLDVTGLLRQMTTLSFGGMFIMGGAMALWSLYMGARLAATRGIPVLVPNFLAFRLKELTLLPMAGLFAFTFLLSQLGGQDFWQIASVLILILIFLFFLQGISFVAWWRAKRGKANRFFYVIACLLFLIPMGQVSLGLLGFIENMTQMRKIGGSSG